MKIERFPEFQIDSTQEREDYVYVKKSRLFIEKEIGRSMVGDWYTVHEEFQKQQARMMTLRESVDFLLALRQDEKLHDGLGNVIAKEEREQIYKNAALITGPSEWLDGRFEEYPNGVYLLQYHSIKTTTRRRYKFEGFADLDPFVHERRINVSSMNNVGRLHNPEYPKGRIDLTSCDNLGLPRQLGDDLYFSGIGSRDDVIAVIQGTLCKEICCHADPKMRLRARRAYETSDKYNA